MYPKVLAYAAMTAVAVITFCTASSLPHITAVGSKFFDANGNQFFIKGELYESYLAI